MVEVEIVLAHLAQLDVVLLVPLGHGRLVGVLVLPLARVVAVDVLLVLVLLEVVLHHVPLLVADVGRVADGADHLHGLEDGGVDRGHGPVNLPAEPARGKEWVSQARSWLRGKEWVMEARSWLRRQGIG